MKTFYCFISIILLITISYNNKIICSNLNVRLINKIDNTYHINADSITILETLYLNLDSIKIGKPFTDKNNNYGYYRLLFSSSEETQTVYVEKIDIIDDGIVKLKRRFNLTSLFIEQDIYPFLIKFVGWKTPEIIEIIVNNTQIHLNLTSLKMKYE
jgi:hypothetical protein